MIEPDRYMVLAEKGTVTRAACTNVSRAEAWQVTRELRAAGEHVYIMRLDAECATCVVAGDAPLPEE
jgi:hypothetical protein